MTPLEHVVVALVPVTAVVLLVERRLPTRGMVAVVVFGAQFPDLVDKPLAHLLYVIPSGRVFMHSLPLALPFIALVVAYTVRTDRPRLGVAYGFAHLSHLLADNYRAISLSPPSLPPDLLWPFVQATPRPRIPAWAGPNEIGIRVWSAYSAVVLAVALVVVARDAREHLVSTEPTPDSGST